jgi:hypothetical protein
MVSPFIVVVEGLARAAFRTCQQRLSWMLNFYTATRGHVVALIPLLTFCCIPGK